MIIIYGTSPVVSLVDCNGVQVWTTGLKTPRNILQTYLSACIMVVSKIDDLFLDMTGIYVINEGGTDVCEEAVLRGAYCINTSMSEGLWHLREIIESGV